MQREGAQRLKLASAFPRPNLRARRRWLRHNLTPLRLRTGSLKVFVTCQSSNRRNLFDPEEKICGMAVFLVLPPSQSLAVSTADGGVR